MVVYTYVHILGKVALSKQMWKIQTPRIFFIIFILRTSCNLFLSTSIQFSPVGLSNMYIKCNILISVQFFFSATEIQLYSGLGFFFL